ncbi:WhiB family transcriptional regulator [Streptomyces cinereoruber]|uniref:WhiB family transcriptional regulator n=1 Tax=Streptomyces cinereoruber TaxID=67260 RepID=UPI00362F49F3
MTTTTVTSSRAARLALTEHRHYAYRGCAPDPDTPQYAAADPDLPLDAWGGSTVDGGLTQADRLDQQRRALAICGRCPVLAQCRTYANSEVPGGGLAEPDGIHGGQTSLDRHRALIERRKTQPLTVRTPEPTEAQLREARSPAKLRVLRQLAVETDAELVAYRAGMDLRSANWQRSALCTLLGLDKETATRQELLETARRYRLLRANARIVPDGPWPIAAVPTTDGARQRRIAPGIPIQLAIFGLPDQPRTTTTAPAARRITGPVAGVSRLTLIPRAPTFRPVVLVLPLPVRTPEAHAA